jgi:AraC-like DNA-binding protein
MVRWDVMRAPMSVQLLITLGSERGVPAEICLARTGLREEVLREPNVEVSAKQELTVVANLVSALGDPPGLGIEAGVRYHLTTYGIWGFALISSPTWRSAIRVGLRHIDLTFAFCRFSAREEDDHRMHLVRDTPDIPPPLQRFVVERDSAAVQTLQQEVFSSPIPIQEVTYTFGAPPGGAARYAEIFGVTPRFDAEENTVGLPPEILDVPLPQANEHTTAMAQAQCRELLAKRLVRTGLAGQVRDHLVTRLAAPPDLDRVAASLHMSDRTLRRRLADEGVSFRGLLDEIREQLAAELLITGGLSVAEVAERLGYVEVSSFSQAFRRWKGVGPRDYRSRHGALTGA